jgi:hypothetical protein
MSVVCLLFHKEPLVGVLTLNFFKKKFNGSSSLVLRLVLRISKIFTEFHKQFRASLV